MSDPTCGETRLFELLQAGVKVSISIDNVTTEANQAFEGFKTRAKLSWLPDSPAHRAKKAPAN